jgi:hypothetical protein
LKIIGKGTYIKIFAKEKHSKKTYTHETITKMKNEKKKLGKEVEMQVG